MGMLPRLWSVEMHSQSTRLKVKYDYATEKRENCRINKNILLSVKREGKTALLSLVQQ